MVKRNAIATKLTKICTQTQKQAFDVAVPRQILPPISHGPPGSPRPAGHPRPPKPRGPPGPPGPPGSP